MQGKIFEGIATALVTPFKNGKLDEQALRKHINFQIDSGIKVLVPCGTTGESPTLSHEEHKKIIAITVEEAAGRAQILAGAGSNSTSEAIDLAEHACKVGANGLLLVSPYYNKPTQEGLYRHFKAISEHVSLPIVLYNIPGRCSVNILPETMERLSRISSIVGVKEASGDLSQMIRTIELCGPDFLVTCGDDALSLPLLAVGGRGIISVASNIIPSHMVALWQAWNNGDLKTCQNLFFNALPLFRSLFIETNPIPVKAALALMNRMEAEMRLPMCPLSESSLNQLKNALQKWELIKK